MKSVPRFWPCGFPHKDGQILQVSTGIFISSLSGVLWFLVALIGVEALGILNFHSREISSSFKKGQIPKGGYASHGEIQTPARFFEATCG